MSEEGRGERMKQAVKGVGMQETCVKVVGGGSGKGGREELIHVLLSLLT